MKFVADECCDAPLVAGLRADGHDLIYIKEVAVGADDGTVLKLAADESRLLDREDKDFGMELSSCEWILPIRTPSWRDSASSSNLTATASQAHSQ